MSPRAGGTDKEAGELEEGFVHLSATVVADEQPLELVAAVGYEALGAPARAAARTAIVSFHFSNRRPRELGRSRDR